jgi:type II secretion system protein G
MRRAFTLIELLIVVAIIAILAAIAIPNFLEAQIRAKRSRALADMRTLATALESYAVDYGEYPGSVELNEWLTFNGTPGANATPRLNALIPLTSPSSYITSIPQDPFNRVSPAAYTSEPDHQRVYVYYGPDFIFGIDDVDTSATSATLYREFPNVVTDSGDIRRPLWTLHSFASDQDLDFNDSPNTTTQIIGTLAVIQPYDATNGSISDGDLVRFRE